MAKSVTAYNISSAVVANEINSGCLGVQATT